MISFHDLNHNGKISFSEFKAIFGHYENENMMKSQKAAAATNEVDFDNFEAVAEEEQKENSQTGPDLKNSVIIRKPT